MGAGVLPAPWAAARALKVSGAAVWPTVDRGGWKDTGDKAGRATGGGVQLFRSAATTLACAEFAIEPLK